MAIEENKVVGIEYTVKDAQSGEVIDSNVGHKPLKFITGKNQIIPGLENQIKNMNAGESADVLVKAEEAYGQQDPNAVQTLPREQFEGIDLQEGMTLYGQGENGETVQVTVKSFDENSVTIDFNHPLAGKDLLFSINITEVREATPEEVMTGQVQEEEHCGGDSCGCGH
ncbi:FKBP-type peptidyl-prolyl cis-trans isomerase SlyD [Nitratiruptor sp. YY08-26]|uniref:FKBP-type peptidyl-prolyl cis-trans isomerase n=1 Tax=unclassified Nitratiruptor TaxID=2624044 RepID=UPI001914F2A4|nr:MULTISPECIES: peptidylprolyl isomerase [unclassified Nitratiruptor]BCD62520.1 FKBP-type peptidyl-prolyl cis-trans isomerase SlyD [Nitratiruptor sp. YY08-13]BCD66456.1 FKBP-type peptidyl-prolyl cis-trans isomerase SlyD [Nitratiruptor sp. YY08-26]